MALKFYRIFEIMLPRYFLHWHDSLRRSFKGITLFLLIIISSESSYATCSLSSESQPRSTIGLQIFHPTDSRTWDAVHTLSPSWLRIEVRWDQLEPSPGKFNWTAFDNLILSATDYNIMVLFNHAPLWATKMDDKGFALAASKAIGFSAKRYRTRVKAWEIFNEPNLPGYGWDKTENSIERYVETFKRTSESIRQYDIKAFIISGGLSPDGTNPKAFLDYLIKTVPTNCYDGIGIHPYGEGDHLVGLISNFKTFTSKPIWFTEYGVEDINNAEKYLNAVSEQAYAFPILFWFSERDLSPQGGTFGLLTYSGKPRAIFTRFREIQINTWGRNHLRRND